MVTFSAALVLCEFIKNEKYTVDVNVISCGIITFIADCILLSIIF